MKDYSKYVYSTGTHYISNNGHDENGGYSGGAAGDQTGDEWCLRSWYSRPWDCVLRYPDENVALMIANMGCAAALNDNCGYDQNQRGTYETALKKAGYNPEDITTKCESDCSSGVIANVRAVGHVMGISALENLQATYTGDMKAGFKAAGFKVLTASKYIDKTDYLLPGDVLLNESHHTCTNVTVGAKASFNPDTSSTNAASDATADPKVVWDSLMNWIGNEFGVAGFMGNIKAESDFKPINLQDSYESKLGYTDQTYTDAVDNGSYSKFSSDAAGYGLCQWTYSTRKKALKSYCDGKSASIGNANAQLGFLQSEVESDFSSMLKTLKKATSVKEASDAVLTQFEKPADQSDSVKTKRANYGQTYYDQYAGSTSSSTTTSGTKKTTDEIVQEVLAGKWGNGDERKKALTDAGYDYDTIQAAVNKAMGSSAPSYTVGKNYTVQVQGLAIRKGAGTNYSKKKLSELTTNAKSKAYVGSDGYAYFNKGAVVTCQKVTKSGSDVWIQIPSGYIAAYYQGNKYVG